MKNIIFRIAGMLIFSLILTSCGSSRASLSTGEERQKDQVTPLKNFSHKNITDTTPQVTLKTSSAETLPEDTRVYNITSFALDFKGTPYKYGGTTREGMDCSGLVYCSFKHEDIPLPRSSRDMAHKGELLSLEEVNIGDLLFFETDRKKKVINHVGLVVEVENGHILFIHSSTSKGVMISSLADNYWFNHFVMARRVI
jgi:cell wall-associated NlpC family hydrolase